MSSPSRMHLQPHVLFITITVFFFLFLVLLPSDGSSSSTSNSNKKRGLEQKKLVLGSRPPSCINKCFSCRPCMATLVIPPGKDYWQKKKNLRVFSHGENNNGDGYYLLSWKCKCGDKFFQP